MKLLAIFLTIMSSAACAETLVIGTSKYNPPFESWVNKENATYAYGYDIDLMTEICRRLQQKCEFKPYEFDDLFPALLDKKINLAISAIIVTENRKESFAFTLPYMESKAQYITNIDSTVDKAEDIYGKKIGARAKTPYGKLAKLTYRDDVIKLYPSMYDMFDGLKNNDVDVCIMDSMSAKNWLASNPNTYKFVGEQISIGDGYAIMLNLDQIKLKEDINRTILDMEADGTFLRIYSQYF